MKIRTLATLLLVGSVFLLGGFAGKTRKGVVVNGVDVGGLPLYTAEEKIRLRISKSLPPFLVHTPAGDFSYKLDFSDDLSALLPRAKRGSYTANVTLQWADAEEEISKLCKKFARDAKDATFSFSAKGFSVRKEEKGVSCDYEGTLFEIWNALKEGRTEATLHTAEYSPPETTETVKEKTRVLSAFSTAYDKTNLPRSHNIVLAAARIAGYTLLPGEEFSFNSVVGERTAANGFEEAPVIVGGEFVKGYGGGVCQASTTLMNAALRAGLTVTESHPHSLSVGYVPPSLDAMVSSGSDLKFRNPYPFPVYLQAKAGDGSITFTVYGMPDGKEYRVESRVMLRVDPPPEKIIEGEEDRVVRSAKQGVASESRLLVYQGGKLLSNTLLRRDTYAVVQGIREVKVSKEEPSENGAEEGGGEAFLPSA